MTVLRTSVPTIERWKMRARIAMGCGDDSVDIHPRALMAMLDDLHQLQPPKPPACVWCKDPKCGGYHADVSVPRG